MDTAQWYSLSKRAIEREYRQDSELFTALLACTSAHTQLKANYTLACRAYNEVKVRGTVSKSHFTGVHHNLILQFLWTGKVGGRKCNPFFRALRGDEEAVPVDIWMYRWLQETLSFRTGRKQPNRQETEDCQSLIRLRASEYGYTPAQYQAVLWCEARGDSMGYADLLAQQRLF